MAFLKFRIYWEEDDAIYRDVVVKHTQNFTELNDIILKAFEFDQKHDATFFRSNDIWKRGREISKAVYEKEYIAPPLLMEETTIGSEIIDTNQHFIFLYDFAKSWTFLIELIQVIKNADADMSLEYPIISRIEGVGPMQYGTKGLLVKPLLTLKKSMIYLKRRKALARKEKMQKREIMIKMIMMMILQKIQIVTQKGANFLRGKHFSASIIIYIFFSSY